MSDENDEGAAYDIEVELTAVLGASTLLVNQLLKLGRGAVVQLDQNVGDPIELRIKREVVARGEVVVLDDQLGITITEMVKG